MDIMFLIVITVLLVIAAILFAVSKKYVVEKLKQETNTDFQKLQKRYLIVYCLACFADWLQGPYVYKLYKQYGYNEGEIAVLFITGTISNSLFGTITGALADIYGRKMLCISYGILYSGCCMTKMFGNFQLLLVGRMLGGISTSILYSAFDSWYINEHINYYKLPEEWLNNTFAKATFFNATLAILAGLLSYFLVSVLEYGPVAPFIMAIPFLITSSIYVISVINEHYIHNTKSASASVKKAVILWITNKNIFTLSVVQSLYEGVMYLFIYIWTPTFDVLKDSKPPLGLVFSSFMLALMIGSKIYSILLGNSSLDSKKQLQLATFTASFSFLICALTISNIFFDYNGQQKYYKVMTCYFCFLLFEISIGMYLPSMTYLKSQVIPEKIRVTISNVIKIPSNLFICLALLWIYFKEPNEKNIIKIEENQEPDVDFILTIFVVCFIATLITFIFSKIFSKFHTETYKDIIKRHEIEV
ncbi:molybdate-anion transporter [Acyrthosiphon pisum]|uniref:Molybdate-anion transporter n=1 Tax=Acyrthosiphon pisum TaxID=7029 RepID=A0A8R2A9K5_ACYPI|nr:molybdate-anion transporter [Acyrthosiphon pisum]XP_008185592.1 molybdate-anion transporter [Acyrthosiphon pisum]XP_029346938.1 molybdate-anion transporter [Acyrthosiphon pisum]|eukprot:XP_001943101.2 PREDICTED: molybdate-anion transporter [Acyrthosiphon pisum]